MSVRIRTAALAATGITLLPLATVRAADAPVIDTGDTAWVLAASALVLMMTIPGLALFYGGLVRAKNVLNVLMQCVLSAGIVGVLWILVGYSLAFGTGNALIGDLSKLGLSGVTMDSVTANFASPPRNIPEYGFVMFQAMFAIITPALILGAIAERMRFDVWCAFITIWLLAVYCPIAHMVWSSEGWLFKSGAIDFAGGLVVHMSSGFSAIVAAIVLGKRRGFGRDPMVPHSLPLCLIGAGLLWTGWFGFNAGSALSASPLATLAFLNTGTAAVAGLVAITPACGNVGPLGAIATGIGVSIVSYAACTFLKPAFGYDDSLDVFGVHALGGAWGALASGLFAVTLGTGIETNAQQVMVQLEGIAFVIAFAPLATAAILLLLRLLFGSLRVEEEAELEGLDLSEHSESAYGLAGTGAGVVAAEAGLSAGSMAMSMATVPDGRRMA